MIYWTPWKQRKRLIGKIPVYRVRNVVSGQEKTLLLPLGFKFHATIYEEDEEFEIVLLLVRELEGEDHLDFDDGTDLVRDLMKQMC